MLRLFDLFDALVFGRKCNERRKEIRYAGALDFGKGQGPCRFHYGNADASLHHAVEDAFTELGQYFGGKIMADKLLNKTVADGDRAGDGQMRKRRAGKPEEAERAGTSALEFGQTADQTAGLEHDISDIDQRARAYRRH